MKTYRLKAVAFLAAVSLSSLAGSAQADQLESILEVGQARTAAAQRSQQTINRLADETGDLLQDYKAELKLIEDLKVYNRKLEIQIEHQEKRLVDIEESIRNVTVIQRQVVPLAVRMLDSLEQFVELDLPFHLEERRQRIQQIRRNLDRDDLTSAEKLRQVLEAYKIENEYGRKIGSYTDTVEIDGLERDVHILRVGRVALLYQTTDTKVTGAWDPERGDWVQLSPAEYRSAVLQGIRMAKKQASIDILNVPIMAPEEAE